MKLFRYFLAVAFLISLALSSNAHAQVENVEIRVDGLACPFCAYGLEKKLKKIEGVGDVKINVDKGIAALKSKEGSSIDVEELEPAVADAGFTPRQITATAVGKVSTVDGTPVLEVSGTDVEFLLKEDETLRTLQAKVKNHPTRVRITGRLEHQTPEGHHSHPFTLVIETFEVVK